MRLSEENPTDGVMKEISRESGKNRGIRHALTIEQQRCFYGVYCQPSDLLSLVAYVYYLLGTGCRIGEALGLRWKDLDFENG